MIKVKEDFNLTDLQKYGFKKEKEYNYYVYNNGKGTICYIFINSRKVTMNVDKYPVSEEIPIIIYRMTIDGILEEK